MFSPIDLDRWDRRAIFEEFLGLDCSFALTRELTITRFHSYVKARGLRFYPSLVWAVVTAVNQHKEFRMGLDPKAVLDSMISSMRSIRCWTGAPTTWPA